MDILQLVDRLEAILNRASHIPFTANVIVNEDELLDIIDQMRIAIPEEIKLARRTQQERARIVSEAQEEADRISEEARRQISTMIEQHELVSSAKRRAEQIVREAQEEAMQMRDGANDYVAQVLSQFSEELAKMQTIVRNGLASVGGVDQQDNGDKS